MSRSRGGARASLLLTMAFPGAAAVVALLGPTTRTGMKLGMYSVLVEHTYLHMDIRMYTHISLIHILFISNLLYEILFEITLFEYSYLHFQGIFDKIKICKVHKFSRV